MTAFEFLSNPAGFHIEIQGSRSTENLREKNAILFTHDWVECILCLDRKAGEDRGGRSRKKNRNQRILGASKHITHPPPALGPSVRHTVAGAGISRFGSGVMVSTRGSNWTAPRSSATGLSCIPGKKNDLIYWKCSAMMTAKQTIKFHHAIPSYKIFNILLAHPHKSGMHCHDQ